MSKQYNYLLRLLLISIACSSLSAQENAREAMNIYPFDHKHIDLENYKLLQLDQFPTQTFKTESIYATRFKGLAIDRLAYKGKLYEIRPGHALLMTDMSTKVAKLLPNKERGLERFGEHFMLEGILLEGADGVIHIKYLSAEHGFHIYKYNGEGNSLMEVQLEHSEKIQQAEFTYNRPYLNYFAHTPWQLIFTSYMPSKAKTVVVELSDGQVLDYEFTSCGIIRDAKTDAFVHGFIQLDPQLGKMQIIYRKQNFSLEHEGFKGYNRAETVLKEHLLFIACYNDRSSGAKLFGINLEEERILWEKSIILAKSNIGLTTTYYNMLWLSLSGNEILVEGLEPDLKYFKAFHLKDGQQIAEFEIAK